MPPPRERFEAGNGTASHIDNRLILEDQVALLDRFPEKFGSVGQGTRCAQGPRELGIDGSEVGILRRFCPCACEQRDGGLWCSPGQCCVRAMAQRGDDLTINVELDDIRNGKQLWGEQYHRKLADLLAVQSDIAREVSQRLHSEL